MTTCRKHSDVMARLVERQFDGSMSAASRARGVDRAHVSRVIAGQRGISPKLAERIEKVTGGLVSRAAALWPDRV